LIEETTVRFDNRILGTIELPCIKATGRSDGPHLCLIGGVHGAEYSSIAAVRKFMKTLDVRNLSGRITAIPIASITSFWARVPFLIPEDGKNLNRCFPGKSLGTFTEALAYHLFNDVVVGSDYLIDMHGGDMVEALEPFVGYDESPVQDVVHGMAVAYGVRLILFTQKSERLGEPGTPTMLRTAATEAGIPALLTEIGDRGQLQPKAVEMHIDGLYGVLRHLKMLPGDSPTAREDQRLVKSLLAVVAKHDGWWESFVEVGQPIEAGKEVGVIEDLYGNELERIAAPADGVFVFLTTSPAVHAGTLLGGFGTELEPLR
jgi:predicted deacylase